MHPLAGNPYCIAAGSHQFIPRTGQEVLVGFLGNDIDRPVVIASLYNGRGASGVPATPADDVCTSNARFGRLADPPRSNEPAPTYATPG